MYAQKVSCNVNYKHVPGFVCQHYPAQYLPLKCLIAFFILTIEKYSKHWILLILGFVRNDCPLHVKIVHLIKLLTKKNPIGFIHVIVPFI